MRRGLPAPRRARRWRLSVSARSCAGCAIRKPAANGTRIAPYTIEEAYEVADAIARDDMDALADELGDLQLQVVFHSQMAEEAGHFTLDDVIGRICDKMERRHPHIFGDAEHGGHHLWEQIKADERAANPDKTRPVRRLSRRRFSRASKQGWESVWSLATQ